MRISSRGQATIELLLVLAVLFIILGYAVQTFVVNQDSVNQKKDVLDAQRSAAIVRNGIELASYSPIGTSLRVFIPPAGQTQDIRIENGIIEVRSTSTAIVIPSLLRDLNVSTFHDGNIIVVSRTLSGVKIA